MNRPEAETVNVEKHYVLDEGTGTLTIMEPANAEVPPSDDDEMERLRNEKADLLAYLDSYDVRQLKNLRKRERELRARVETLMKLKWFIDVVKMLSGPEINVDKNCPRCPFFVSWLQVFYPKKFGAPLYAMEAEGDG